MTPFVILCVVLAYFCVPLSYASDIKGGDRLTLEMCIEIAVKSHPEIVRDKQYVKEREAVVGQAQSAYYPRVDLSAQYKRYFKEKNTRDKWFPVGTHNENTAVTSLDQLVFDFGKTPAEIRSKKYELNAAQFTLESTSNNIVNLVKASYYGVLKARRSRDVNLEIVDQYKKHLDVAQIFFTAGKKPKYDVTKAELDLSNAQLQLITAENTLKVSWVRLVTAMGLDKPVEFSIEDTFGFTESTIGLEEALEIAYRERPDLKSLKSERDSAQASLDKAKKEYYPTVTGQTGYNALGSSYPLSQQWYGGLSFTVNIFDGFLTRNRIDESFAKTRAAGAQMDAKRLDIYFDVKDAYLNLIAGKETIANTEVQIRQSTENLELANLRYKAGLADPLEVTDATVSYSQAKLANIKALYDYKIQRANLERAMGKR